MKRQFVALALFASIGSGCAARALRDFEVGPGKAYPPTPSVMYGFSPISYDAPSGRTIRIHDLDGTATAIASVGGFASAGSATGPTVGTQGSLTVTSAPYRRFKVTYGEAISLECNEDSGPAWFMCRSLDSPLVSFEMGQGARCVSNLVGLAAYETSGNRACWEGTARVGDASFQLTRGEWRHEIVWLDAQVQPVLSVSLRGHPRFFATKHSVQSDLDDILVALSFAVHFHEDARSNADAIPIAR
jgi:hypothetical protein